VQRQCRGQASDPAPDDDDGVAHGLRLSASP
jgi:hypothetical protein